jgi:hypothetical protein
MPWVKISSESHKDMKQFLVDVEGLNLGELVEASFEFCMENLEAFEKFLELENVEDESEETDEDKQDEEDETEKEDD